MKIENAEQFDRVFPAIANELVYANLYYKLFIDINSSFVEYQKEVNESTAFWGITRDSIRDVSFLSLCRVYDPEKSANSLPNLLIFIKGEKNFGVNTQKAEHGQTKIISIDEKQLDEDIRFVTKENPAVRRLISWRGNIFVHKNAKHIADAKPLSVENIPKYEDFESLLKQGMRIVNRYADLFRSTEYSTHFGQGDDFKFVLDSVRERLKLHEKKIEAEFKKYGLERETFSEENHPLNKT